jgi:hypothetical protein
VKVAIDWLLEGPSYVRYRTLIDLLHRPEDDKEVKSAYKEMVADLLVQNLINEVNDWENQPALTNHRNAVHPLHKLTFLAGLGIKKDILKPAIDLVLNHQSEQGAFELKIALPKAFGGDGRAVWTWMACDAPLILYALLRQGLGKNKQVRKAVDHLRSTISDNGYRCYCSPVIKWRGPGRKEDPCPYVNLIALRAFAQLPDLLDSPEAHTAAEMLLHHWEKSREKKYYMFVAGRNFRKIKTPRVWYDIIHVADTLSRFPFLRKDKRLKEMLELLRSKADNGGRFTSESIWTKWKGWEFSKKKEPSRWVTFLACRILRGVGS